MSHYGVAMTLSRKGGIKIGQNFTVVIVLLWYRFLNLYFIHKHQVISAIQFGLVQLIYSVH